MSEACVHLVLGASLGIGRAYAMRYARRGHDLIIVGRSVERLDEARRDLLQAGSASVQAVAFDLACSRERPDKLATLSELGPYASVFVGGLGPTGGPLPDVTPDQVFASFDACVRYPDEVLRLAPKLMGVGGRLVVLSSSASTEPLAGHTFYLSAAFRRILDVLVAEQTPVLGVHDIRLVLLRPKVVFTTLAEKFGAGMVASGKGSSPVDALCLHFGVRHVPSAEEFIETALDD